LDPKAPINLKPRPDLLNKPQLQWKVLLEPIAGGTSPQFQQAFDRQWKVWQRGGVAPVEVAFPRGKLIMFVVRDSVGWRVMTVPEDAWSEELTMQGY
jgi:hypothetical protein